MKRTTLIDGVTAGVTTEGFNVYHNQPATLAQRGIAGVETGTLQIMINGTYKDVYDNADNLVQFTVTNNIIFIEVTGTYRLVLTATAGATSVDKTTSGV